MSSMRSTLLAIVVVLAAVQLQATDTTWSGTVHRYHRVIGYDTCPGQLIVDPAPVFRPGDRILLHQAKGGALIDTTNTPDFGLVFSIGSAGVFELLTVHHVAGNRIALTTDLRRTYDFTQDVQCIGVAHARSARIADTLRGKAWDGFTGGVIVVECDDTLVIDAPIDASRIGFRGGRASVNRPDTNVTDWAMPEDAGAAGRKGESCVLLPDRLGAGRGPNATGGGGGNARNGGGGGGANVSAGGRGGDQTTEFGAMDVGGRGGNGIVPASTDVRALFGGGGGGGHQNDMFGSDGGHGGGVVIIRSPVVIVGPNGRVSVSADHARQAVFDGAGGGGGGGSVILDVGSMSGNLTIDAQGGNGGDVQGTKKCYAPGGGGAGGLIMLTTSSGITQTSIDESILGGRAGRYYGSASECPVESSFGATPGSFGAVTRVGDIDGPSTSILQPTLSPRDTVVCEDAVIALRVDDAASVRWTIPALVEQATSASTRTVPMRSSVVLPVEITTVRGCTVMDSVRVTVLPAPKPRLVYPATVLTPQAPTISMSTDAPFVRYQWSTGDTTAMLDVQTAGRYWVRVIDTNGCEGVSDTVDVRSALNGAVVRFAINDALIVPGERTRVVVRARVADTLLTDAEIDVDLFTRATLMLPEVEGSITGTTPDVRVRVLWTEIDERSGIVQQRLRWSLKAGDPRQRTISVPYIGALGDSASAQVAFVDCTPSDPSIICIIERQGRASLDTLCREGGRDRLFDPFAGMNAMVANGVLHVEGDVEDAHVTCVDLLGRVLDVRCEAESRSMRCSVTDQASGARWWMIERAGRIKVVADVDVR